MRKRKLTSSLDRTDIQAIFDASQKMGTTDESIAHKYGISKSSVSRILNGNWIPDYVRAWGSHDLYRDSSQIRTRSVPEQIGLIGLPSTTLNLNGTPALQQLMSDRLTLEEMLAENGRAISDELGLT